jgi:hypothetical protein
MNTLNLDQFKPYDDGRFQCLSLTLDDGRYVVITDTGGMGYPEPHDFNVCIYRCEDAFGDDPTDSVLASATSDQFDNLNDAIKKTMEAIR